MACITYANGFLCKSQKSIPTGFVLILIFYNDRSTQYYAFVDFDEKNILLRVRFHPPPSCRRSVVVYYRVKHFFITNTHILYIYNTHTPYLYIECIIIYIYHIHTSCVQIINNRSNKILAYVHVKYPYTNANKPRL